MEGTGRGAGMLATVVLALAAQALVPAAELKPATIAAFERYVRATESRIAREVADEARFLVVDAADAAAGGRCWRTSGGAGWSSSA